ncbi:unnamed protein product [Pedinophyceae sp. YPF-701]|nr:unnamed protein product [Pedinophyceae sp. YPF-701]
MLQDQLRETQEAAETEISELRKQIEQMSTEQTAKARKDAVISRFQGVLDKARQMESQREVSSFKVEVRKKLEQKEAAQQRLRDNYKDAVRELEQVKLEKATLEREAGSAKEQMRTFADAKAALDADCRRARAEAQAAMAMVRNLEELLDQQNSKVEELAFSALRPALQEELMKVRGGQELAGWMKESGLVASSCALALKPAREVAEALRELSRGAAGEILELASAHDVSALLGQICHDSVEQAADLVALIRSGQVQRIAAIFSMMDEADGARLADRVSYDLAPEAFTNGDVAAAKAQGFGDAAKRSEVLRAMVDKFRRAEAMLRQGDDEFDALMWSLQHGTATGAAGQAAGSPTGEDADDAATQRTMSSRQRRLAGAMSHSARTSSTAGSIDLGTEGGHGMEAAIHKIGSIASELAAAVADMDAGTIAEILRGKNAALKAGVLAALDPEKAAAVSAYDNRQAEMQARLAKDDAAALRREHPEYENLQNLLATLEEADTTAEVRDLLPEVLGKAHEIYNVTLSVRQVIEDEEREKDTELGADEASMLFLSSMEVLGSTEIAFDRWLNGGDDDDDGTRAPQEPEVLATPDKTAAGGKARANTMTVSAAHKAKRDAVADLARRAAISTGKQCKEAMAKGVRQIDEMAMATPIIGTVDDKEQTVGVVTSTHLPGHVCPCCDSEVSSRPVAGDQLEIAGRIAEAVGKALTNALNSEAKLMKRVEEVLLGPSGMQLEIPAEIKDAQKLRTALERVVQKVSLRIQDSSQLRKQLAEIKSYSKPPRTVVVVMLLAFMLLSEPGLSQAAPGFVVPADPSRLWMYLRRSIVIERSTKRYLPRRMGTIIRSLREKPLASAVQRAGEEMMAGVGHEDAVKASQCLALIRMWGLAVLNMGMVQEQIMKLLDE